MTRLHVLVVEDCPDSRQAVCSFLMRVGLDVTPAENGRKAIELARSENFDFILMDMQMPEVNGYQSARQIRQDGYRGPILALTGDVQPGSRQACIDAGCDAYLAKPWEPNQLMSLLKPYLNEVSDQTNQEPETTTTKIDSVLRPLSREFALGLPQTVAEMTAALETKDHQLVARLAHRTSGTAGMFGYADLARVARQVEEAVLVDKQHNRLDERIADMTAIIHQIVRDSGNAE